MIDLQWIYWLAGGYVAVVAVRGLTDRSNPRRLGTALFWGLLAFAFLLGDRVPPVLMGLVVLLLAALAGFGAVGRGAHPQRPVEARHTDAARLGHWLFVPALLIPIVTVLLALPLKDLAIAGHRLLDREHTTLIALGLACVVAVLAGCLLTRASPARAVEESRRLIDAIGWALLLPLLLATLGSVFAASQVGDLVSALVRLGIPVDSRLAVVLAYGLGMVVFTMIMGNAFAAFPVMTGGIGLPLLVGVHGAEPASMAAIGMLTGYCGTLLTPMAANFNLVPAALLELDDPNGVIRAQVGTALPLLGCNLVLLYTVPFR